MSGTIHRPKITPKKSILNEERIKISKVIYTGVFINAKELERQLEEHGVERQKLWRDIHDTHVTFQFRPTDVDESLFGRPVDIRVVGYGVNPQNEGLLVEICCADKKVQRLCEQVEVPHITLSVSEKGKPVNTRYVDFAPIENPFTVQGVYDAFQE